MEYKMEESQANIVIMQWPEILEKIFSNFNVKTLCRAARVNKLWNEMAMCELQKRRPQIMVLPVSNIRDVLETKPAVTLVFVNAHDTPKYKLMKIDDCFPNEVMFVSTHIIMMDEKIITKPYVTSCDECGPQGGISLSIPEFQDLKIRVAYNADLPHSNMIRDDTLNQIFLNDFLPGDTKLKATFIIIGHASSILKLLTKSMKERQQEYVIWGATFPMTALSFWNPIVVPDTEDVSGLFAISFAGLSMESSSIVIKLKEIHHLDQKLKDFRKTFHLKRHNIGLLCSPDYLMHYNRDSKDFEMLEDLHKQIPSTVKKIFPEVALISFFDNICCYGFNTTTDDADQEIEHSDSLSLMILTYD